MTPRRRHELRLTLAMLSWGGVIGVAATANALVIEAWIGAPWVFTLPGLAALALLPPPVWHQRVVLHAALFGCPMGWRHAYRWVPPWPGERHRRLCCRCGLVRYTLTDGTRGLQKSYRLPP